MEEPDPGNLFPQLLEIFPNPLLEQQFQKMAYFSCFESILPSKQWKPKIQKSRNYFQLIRIKKGTVIYNYGDSSDRGYILLHGCVEVLGKKNLREKTEIYPGHILHTPVQKVSFLHKNYCIPKQKGQLLLNNFYEEKLFFKFLNFTTFYGNNDFGFGQMVRNSLRTQTTIATEDSELIFITRKDFDDFLRDFQTKKEKIMIDRMLLNVKGEWVDDLSFKMNQIMNSANFLTFNNEDVIYESGYMTRSVYYIINGQVQIRKSIQLQVPKKSLLHNENKGAIEKETILKISRVSAGNFFGEYEIFQNKKKREFTLATTLNNTLILKIDQNIFQKVVGEFTHYERQLISNSRQKQFLANEKLEEKRRKIQRSFQVQIESIENKKKQKMFSNFLNSQSQQKNQMFEVFSPEGVFYRDTFEKLQGFDLSLKQPRKQQQSIKRTKVTPNNSSKNKPEKPEIKIQTKSQILLSPKKNISPVGFMEKDSMQMQKSKKIVVTPIKQEKSFKQKYKSLGKFEDIKKDDLTYKRVLIKYGQYPKDRKIDKSKSIKPLIHKDFDQVVSQCITRKNQVIKRTTKEKQKKIILDNYNKTVQVLNKHGSMSLATKFSKNTPACRGTEEMKKRLKSFQKIPNAGRSQTSKLFKRNSPNANQQYFLQVNQKPTSSPAIRRLQSSKSQAFYSGSPEKIVLLNHMMKPMTYYSSVQI